MNLELGTIYKRTDIQNFFGGQRQGGISTPSKRNLILIFSGESGHSYGYQDGWTEDGYFLYTGEGQVGNMDFVRGNRAIRDHGTDGKKYTFLYTNGKRMFVMKVRSDASITKYLEHPTAMERIEMALGSF